MMMMMMTMMTVKMRPELLTEKVINIHKQTFATSDTTDLKKSNIFLKQFVDLVKRLGIYFSFWIMPA